MGRGCPSTPLAMVIQSSLFLILHLLVLRVAARDCAGLRSLEHPNVSITDAVPLAPGTTFNTSADLTCFQPTYNNTVAICRVSGVANTSSTSSITFEMWLPDTWYGRVLTVGNGGLGGCKYSSFHLLLSLISYSHSFCLILGIGYPHLDHGSALNFATIGTNNGHDGIIDPTPFFMPSRVESVTDFSHRAVHVIAVLGKAIASTYYGTKPHHSYYNGCSAGGRQGISVASRYPEDFDGVIAGAPALDWNRFVGAPAVWATYVAANTSREIPLPLWQSLVSPEILKQCDGIDGKVDGIITDPTLCSWNPETLLCGPGDDTTTCLAQDQIDGLKKFYQPILDTEGEVLFHAFEPGAEGDIAIGFPMNGVISMFTIVRPPFLGRVNRIAPYSPHPFDYRRSGTTMRYMGNPRGRMITSQSLISNTRVPLIQSEFPPGRTLSRGWENSGTKAGR